MTAKMDELNAARAEVASLQAQLTDALAEGLREQLAAEHAALVREQHHSKKLKAKCDCACLVVVLHADLRLRSMRMHRCSRR
ncbi:unnamed protein product [Sphagnum balticum]